MINLTQVCLEIGMIITAKRELEDSYVSQCLYGFAVEFSSFYLRCLVPLMIADRNRKGQFELTMAGTIMAIIQLAYYSCEVIVSAFLCAFVEYNEKYEYVVRLVVIFLLLMSTYFAISLAKVEWN